ncbi:MAG: hypothetical protein U0132_24000 [Gemmatimonadaceae bacterium]
MRRSVMCRLLPLTAIAAAAIACGSKETTSTTQVAFEVSPASLAFSDLEPIKKAYLTTTPSGGNLDWQVTAKPQWLKVTPENGRISGKIVELTLDASALAQMDAGYFNGRLDFVSSGGTGSIALVAQSLPAPRISVTQSPVDLDESADSGRFVVKNTGKDAVSVSAATPNAWITTRVETSFLRRTESTFVRVVVNKESLPAGVATGSVSVTTTPSVPAVTVPVTAHVASSPRPALDASRVAFLAGENQGQLILSNTGKGSLAWSVASGVPWLSAVPNAGSLSPNESVTLALQLDRTRLPGPEAQATLTLTSNAAGSPLAVPVLVTASPGFSAGLTVLTHRVIDAEPSPRTGLIVTVSAQPSQLNILDVITGAVSSVPLSSVPTSVAVRPDGAFAAVGHDAKVTLVDLNARAVVREYAVSADILDIVLPMNGWAYAFPIRDQWTAIRSIELATGNVNDQTNHPGIYAGTYARLHPDGRSIYGSQTQLSPADHERYDISKGVAVRLYDSRYHGDYPMGGDAWISDDGTRLFNRWAHAFRLSPNQSDDITYAGKLSGITDVRWVTDAPGMQRVLAVIREPAAMHDRIHSYNSNTLAFTGTIPLPSFPSVPAPVAAQGRFVFVMRNRVYALVQANPGGGLLNDWGLASFSATQVP